MEAKRCERLLILGIGNMLLADEGVGVHAAQTLRKKDMPEGVAVLDIGTAILEALPELEQADRVIVIDAVMAGKKPGTVYRIAYDDCEKPMQIASVHGFDLSRVLAMTSRKLPPPVVVIGVEPARIGWSLELSVPVAEALDVVLQAVESELLPPLARRRRPPDPAVHVPGADGLREKKEDGQETHGHEGRRGPQGSAAKK
jgi:hydrogenase maturation protease